jgi:hypothetical protein
MTRVAPRRGLAVAALVAATTLAACTGNTADEPESSPTPAIAATEATTTAETLVEKAAAARLDTSKGGDAAREAVYSGAALESANAYAKSLTALKESERDQQALSTDAEVLAVSRVEESPRQILVRGSREKSGDPVLFLLQSEDGDEDFSIVAEAAVLPESQLAALDPTSIGSPSYERVKLTADPQDVLAAYAESVNYPDPKESPLVEADPLSDQLRATAKSQGEALGDRGVFTQTHTVDEIIGGLGLKDGDGAVVFANLQRDDLIALRRAAKLTPSKDVRAITGIKQITSEAQLTSNEIVAVVIPSAAAADSTSTGGAGGSSTAIAAWDQLVSGDGR